MLMPANIILGSAQFGLEYGINNLLGKPTEETVFEILSLAYQSGIRTIDTSEVYGNAFDLIGQFHRKTGNLFSVNTKLVNTIEKNIRTELISNLEKLGIGNFETCFYHNYYEYVSGKQFVEQLEKLKSEKLLNSIGVTIYTNTEFETLIEDNFIDVIQLPFNLLDNHLQRGGLLAKAKMAQKKIQVRSVFLQGLFFKDPELLSGKLMPLKPYLQEIQQISRNNGLSTESLCLQYVNAETGIDEMVIGVDTVNQLQTNLSFINTILPETVKTEIDKIAVQETELLYPFNW